VAVVRESPALASVTPSSTTGSSPRPATAA
jgi:hypothetical protein